MYNWYHNTVKKKSLWSKHELGTQSNQYERHPHSDIKIKHKRITMQLKLKECAVNIVGHFCGNGECKCMQLHL